jgi:organic hydroperoxide reductase OsmC/OhrA
MVTRTRETLTTAADEKTLTVSLTLDTGYRFEADTGLPGVPRIALDEPAPLGEGAGPNPARLLTIAVANCLASSLLFCLRKAHIDVSGMRAVGTATMGRNEGGRLRVTGIEVTLVPAVARADVSRMGRCVDIFEDFCPVTNAVRPGVNVSVSVAPVAV